MEKIPKMKQVIGNIGEVKVSEGERFIFRNIRQATIQSIKKQIPPKKCDLCQREEPHILVGGDFIHAAYLVLMPYDCKCWWCCLKRFFFPVKWGIKLNKKI